MRTLLACVLCLLGLEGAAAAHVVDEYLQVAQLTIAPAGARVELRLTPGASVAERVLPWIDRDGDGTISPAEGQAYAQRVLQDLSLDVDGRRAALVITGVEFPAVAEMNGGVGEIRLELASDAPLDRAGEHHVTFRNDHRPELGAYLANVLVPTTDAIAITGQQRDRLQHELRVDFRAGQGVSDWMRCAAVLGVVLLLLVPWSKRRRIVRPPRRGAHDEAQGEDVSMVRG